MRREPATEESIAEARTFGSRGARHRTAGSGPPSAGVRVANRPRAAICTHPLLRGGRSDLSRPPHQRLRRTPRSRAHAISSLGLQYSAAHADDRSLAAETEAAELARRLNRHRDDGKNGDQNPRRLRARPCRGRPVRAGRDRSTRGRRHLPRKRGPGGATPHPTVSCGRSSIWRSTSIWPDGADVSLEIEREAIQIKRRMDEAEPRCLPGLVLWLAGVSSRFTDAGHPQEAGELLEEAIATCNHLPPEGDRGNFGFHQAVHAALFARSGARDERSVDGRTIPIGVSQVSSHSVKPFMEFLGESLPIDAVDDGPGRLVAPVLRVRDILVPRRHACWKQRSTAQIHLSDFFQP